VSNGVVDFSWCDGVMFVGEIDWRWLQWWNVVTSGRRGEEGGAEDAAFVVKVGVEGVIGLVLEGRDGLGVGWVSVSKCFPDCGVAEVAEVFDLEGLFGCAACLTPVCSCRCCLGLEVLVVSVLSS
jgi:hypothetical protein